MSRSSKSWVTNFLIFFNIYSNKENEIRLTALLTIYNVTILHRHCSIVSFKFYEHYSMRSLINIYYKELVLSSSTISIYFSIYISYFYSSIFLLPSAWLYSCCFKYSNLLISSIILITASSSNYPSLMLL